MEQSVGQSFRKLVYYSIVEIRAFDNHSEQKITTEARRHREEYQVDRLAFLLCVSVVILACGHAAGHRFQRALGILHVPACPDRVAGGPIPGTHLIVR
jgi:hypothetical protein